MKYIFSIYYSLCPKHVFDIFRKSNTNSPLDYIWTSKLEKKIYAALLEINMFESGSDLQNCERLQIR
jgi:hypothetical protein